METELNCTSCQEMKPPECFYKNKKNNRGRDYWCRDCQRKKAGGKRNKTTYPELQGDLLTARS